MFKVGDKIRILHVSPDAKMDDYVGREGKITRIDKDHWGDTYLHGTWGGCSVCPEYDDIELVK